MKRYTLRFGITGALTDEKLKAAVEDILLHLHPRFTFRLGRSARIDPQNMTVEIASDGKKEILEPHLKSIEKKLPVVLEHIDWGWDSGDSSLPSSPIQNPDLSPDPLTRVEPSIGPAVFTVNAVILWSRYALFFVLLLVLGITLYFKFLDRSPL
jgi:hypothetical protein